MLQSLVIWLQQMFPRYLVWCFQILVEFFNGKSIPALDHLIKEKVIPVN